jgi:hypothetical protein
MLTKNIQNRFSAPAFSHIGKIGKGMVLAGVIAALSLTTIPTTAQAGGVGAGAAIGLGVLGGVLAGAAIASTTPPVYAPAPAPVYEYPPQPWQGYYSTPTYYPAAQPYYGWSPYYR